MTEPVYPWERRREGEPTNEYLARVLRNAGLAEMAQRAKLYHFDDYRAPDRVDNGDNMVRLVAELQRRCHGPMAAKRTAIRAAAIAGEFDGTAEESRAWMAENPEVFADFTRGPNRAAPCPHCGWRGIWHAEECPNAIIATDGPSNQRGNAGA